MPAQETTEGYPLPPRLNVAPRIPVSMPSVNEHHIGKNVGWKHRSRILVVASNNSDWQPIHISQEFLKQAFPIFVSYRGIVSWSMPVVHSVHQSSSVLGQGERATALVAPNLYDWPVN